MITLKVDNLKKRFERKTIFSNITFTLNIHRSLSIVGRNGIGKSTMLKTIAGLLAPTEGTINLEVNGKSIARSEHYKFLGFVSPYLQLYDEFTGLENLVLFKSMRGLSNDCSTLASTENLLNRFGIWQQRNDLVRTYSTGMKQRLKFAVALIHKPALLIIDEPTVNLDEDGQAKVLECINEQKENGIVIIATNNRDEFNWCDEILDLEETANFAKKMA